MSKTSKRPKQHKQRELRSEPRRRRGGAAALPGLDAESIGLLEAEIEPGVPDPADVAQTVQIRSPEIPELAGGDLDATFYVIDSGEEAVGGSDPTPDQNDVDLIGNALGIVEPEGAPLATTERIEARDRDRWELDPDSAEDREERERAETEAPPRRRRARH
jgi:hypothetical protein